ncbi:MAG: prepilin-type N-terminal cleavage/methylation domain-containing protein [Candidatus Omnitrophota bacterium]|nr:MAG: prepilin-type N-terminal cleavage/methylation domain-containing protein [Candidatus Omnitrophota bacterium]
MFRQRGFTLIELLIVIAVISILIGIALPRFRGMREEGLIAQAKGELRTLQTAVESYYIHNRIYPATFPDDLETATPNIIGTTAPTDPFNIGNDYVFLQSPNAKYYVLYSVGPAGTGSATISSTGVVTEDIGESCIYVSNGTLADTQP